MTPEGETVRRRQRVAVYGICREDGHVLLTRAAASLTVAGRWFLPGGGIDHGEDPVTALRREFAEETGLEVLVGPLLGVLSDLTDLPDGTSLHTVRLVYRIENSTGDLADEIGGSTDAARWVPLAEVSTYPLMPYVVRALHDFG